MAATKITRHVQLLAALVLVIELRAALESATAISESLSNFSHC
jgi:hypothetical protein